MLHEKCLFDYIWCILLKASRCGANKKVTQSTRKQSEQQNGENVYHRRSKKRQRTVKTKKQKLNFVANENKYKVNEGFSRNGIKI